MKRSLLSDLTKTGEGARPVHFLAGLAGSHRRFRPLARELSARWRLRGVLYPVFAGADPHCPSIEALAEQMEPALAEAEDPIVFCGYSFGGTVAYEMACRIVRQGRPAAVVLLDSTTKELLRLSWLRMPRWQRRLIKKRRRLVRGLRALRDYLTRSEGTRAAPAEPVPPQDETLAIFHRESLEASRAYIPPRLDVPVVMVRAVRPWQPAWLRRLYWPDWDRGWSIVTPVVGVVPCPGTHLSIAEAENAQILAPALDEALQIAWDAALARSAA